MEYFKQKIYLLLLMLIIFGFFLPQLIQNKLPIPSDALLGLYHPWRDLLSGEYSHGMPYKNPLITDPIRQQIPYRKLAIDQLKSGSIPYWNSYAFSGTPLLGNIQTAAFYPLNILFWIFDFKYAWSFLVILQPLLGGFFIYLYLQNLKLNSKAILLGGVGFSFSGFFVAWLTWNTIVHTILWLPLILLALDKLLEKLSLRWLIILSVSLVLVLLAGHLQIAMYVVIFSLLYGAVKIRTINPKNAHQAIIILTIIYGLAFLVTSFQTLPALEFISLSARTTDLVNWNKSDWFIPPQHLIQFFAPDFFGNPTTGNYWGIWNYGEYVGYIGVIPFLFAIYAIFHRHDKKTLFFTFTSLGLLILALPTPLSKIPYFLKIPYYSTLQPSRILGLVCFTLPILSSLGMDYFLRQHKKYNKIYILFLISLLLIVWLLVLSLLFSGIKFITPDQAKVAFKNLILPSVLLILGLSFYIVYPFIKGRLVQHVLLLMLLSIVVADAYRFSYKFTPFTHQDILFPTTKTIDFLKNHIGNYRFMTTDSRILPPNVSTYYKLADVAGYDPIYLDTYGRFVAMWKRGVPDLSVASFNRILEPQLYDSFVTDLLGVKYIVTFERIVSNRFREVFKEGETLVYENLNVFPRAFLVEQIKVLDSNEAIVRAMFSEKELLPNTAYALENLYILPTPLKPQESVEITSVNEQRLVINVQTTQVRMLVVSNIYYPGWNVYINGNKSSIFPVDYLFQGVFVPKGESIIEFRYRN